MPNVDNATTEFRLNNRNSNEMHIFIKKEKFCERNFLLNSNYESLSHLHIDRMCASSKYVQTHHLRDENYYLIIVTEERGLLCMTFTVHQF